jgi:putative spermidine/putrescine transport system permease protein
VASGGVTMRRSHALLLLSPAGLLIGVMFLLPFGVVVLTSFWSQKPGSWIVDDSFTGINYRRLLNDPYFADVVWRTLRISAIATLTCLAIGFPLARWIAGSRGQWRGLLIALMLMPVVCGALVQTLGLVNLLSLSGVVSGGIRATGLVGHSVHLLGNEWGVLVGLVQAFLPLMVLPLAAMLGRLPAELEEAAATLGAGPLRVIRRVVVPLAAPGLITGSILVFAACLTSFVTPQILGQGHVQIFGPLVYQQAALVLDWPFASALAVLMLVCLAAAALLIVSAGRIVTRRRDRA